VKPPRIQVALRELRVNGLPARDVERFRSELVRGLQGSAGPAKPDDTAARLAQDAAAQIRAKLPAQERKP
jgi:hypothetical protein